MASPALPIDTLPSAPSTSTPPAAPSPSHDAAWMAEQFANRMKAGANPPPPSSPPTPGAPPSPVPAPPATPAQQPPPTTQVAPTVTTPMEAPAGAGAPGETTPPSLDDFDFDNPDAPKPDSPAAGAQQGDGPSSPSPTPASPDADLLELKALLGDVDPAKLDGRGRRIYSTFKAMRALEAPADQGGIGFVPTPEDIKRYYETGSNWEAAQFEFETNPHSWLANHFGPDPQTGAISPAAAGMVDALLPTLHDLSPQLFNRAVEPLIASTLTNLQRQLDTLPEGQGKDTDPFGVDDRTRLQDAIDILSAKWGRAAAPRTGAPAPGRPAAVPTANPNDPFAAERAKIDQERQALQQERQVIQDAVIGTLKNYVRSTITTAVTTDIENLARNQGITPDRFPTPWMYNQWIENFRSNVASAVTGERSPSKRPYDPIRWDNFQLNLKRASAVATSGSLGRQYDPKEDPNAKQAVNTYRLIAQSVIKSLAPEFLKDAGGSIVDHNAARTQAQAPTPEALTQREPALAGGNVQHSVVAPPDQITRNPGEDPTDYARRFIDSRMAAARNR